MTPAITAPSNGRKTMASYMLPLALHQIDVVDGDRAAVAEIGDQDGEPDGRFRRRHREHEERIDLADDVAQEGRERHQVDVDGEQDELDRHQDDDDVLAVEEDAQNPEREQDRGDREIMAEPDRHCSPCPDLTLTTSMAVERRRATWSEIFCRRTFGLCCRVSTMAPTMATRRMMPAAWK